MKKMIVFSILFLTLFFVSCGFQTSQSQGTLVISNYSENENLTISSVYVKEKEATGYQLVYSGSIQDTQSYFIELNPGAYSVKIQVIDNNYGLFDERFYYETGYNIYENTDSRKAIYVTFDGKGIFFD